MPRETQLQVSPEIAANKGLLNFHLAKLFGLAVHEIQKVVVLKRSIDARQKAIKINLKVAVFLNGENVVEQRINLPEYKNVSNKQEVIIVGAGPARLSRHYN